MPAFSVPECKWMVESREFLETQGPAILEHTVGKSMISTLLIFKLVNYCLQFLSIKNFVSFMILK